MLNRKGFYEKEERRLIREDIARRHRFAKHKDRVESEIRHNNRIRNHKDTEFNYVSIAKLGLIVCVAIAAIAGLGLKLVIGGAIVIGLVYLFTGKKRRTRRR